MDPNNPQNQTPFNPNTPISEVLKQEKEGYTPSATVVAPAQKPNTQGPTLGDVVGTIGVGERLGNFDHQARIIKTYKSDAESVTHSQQPSPSVAPRPFSSISQQPPKPVPQAMRQPFQQKPLPPQPAPQPSIVEIAVAENERKIERQVEIAQEEISNPVAPKKKILVPILVVLFLLGLGLASIPAVQYFLKQKTVAVPIVNEHTIIPFDQKVSITLEKTSHDDLTTAIQNLPANTANIKYVEIFQKILDANQQTVTTKVSTNTFASLLGKNIPASLVRSFDGDYMYGVSSVKHPRAFILLKTSSYDQAFAGMLKWEIKIVTDLSPILNIPSKVIDQPLVDRIITSKDVRAIVLPDGATYLLYGFIDNQTLLITTDVQTFQDVSTRYVTSRFVQ